MWKNWIITGNLFAVRWQYSSLIYAQHNHVALAQKRSCPVFAQLLCLLVCAGSLAFRNGLLWSWGSHLLREMLRDLLDKQTYALGFALSVSQIRWLLEDEIVSALRHSRVITSDTLHKVAEHVVRSSGRPHCHCEDVPLQFVFRPEQSLEKFKEAGAHTHSHTHQGVRRAEAAIKKMHLQEIWGPQKMNCDCMRYSILTATFVQIVWL